MMLKCLFIRRKLYDYLDNSLSGVDKIKVSRHLNVCGECSQRLSEIKNILDLAVQKEMPRPTEEFWHNFKIDLDRELNQRLAPPATPERKFHYRLRPVLVYTLALVFILVIGNHFYKFSRTISGEDAILTDEMTMLDEISEEPYLNHNEDAYIEEINLFYSFGQDLT